MLKMTEAFIVVNFTAESFEATSLILMYTELECGPMPNVMAAQPNISGALYENSVIPFLVPRHKVWLTAAARVSCSSAANIGERKTWAQSEFCSWQNSVRGKSPQKCTDSVPAQETAKHPAKFC